MRYPTLHTSWDLQALILDLRCDAAEYVDITPEWCRDQMHYLGVTRYEDVDESTIDTICLAVDELVDV